MRRILHLTVLSAIVFPFLFLVLLSLGRSWPYPEVLPTVWTLEHWQSLFSGGGSLAHSLGLSLLISCCMATTATVLGMWVSRQFAMHPWKERLLSLAYLPYVFSPVILAACLQHFFLRFNLAGRLSGVLPAHLLITFPFALLFFSSFWNPNLIAMEQLVYTLGGNRRQALRRVILPAARGPLLVCFFQTFLISWFEYGLTLLIGLGKVPTLPIRVFQYVNEANLFLAALSTCLIFLPPIILLWVNRRFLKFGI